MLIYFDGGCRPNPGKMNACVVMRPPIGRPEIMVMNDLGEGTNNLAEWSALVWAATIAGERRIGKPVFLGDSQLVINQASGLWKINDETFSSLCAEFHNLTKGLDFNLQHVPRARNLAGVYLEKGHL